MTKVAQAKIKLKALERETRQRRGRGFNWGDYARQLEIERLRKEIINDRHTTNAR